MIMTTKKLYVGNLPKGCTSQMLSEIFEKFGAVVECDVIRNYGFVHMTNETEAQEAVTNLDDSNFMGSQILVQFSTTDVHKAPGVGSQGECFRCGNRGHLSRECPEGGTKPRRRGGRGGGRGGSRGGGGYRGGRDRGRSSGDYWDSYYYDYPPPRRLPPPGYDYDRRPPLPRDYPYPPAYRSRSRSPPGRRPPPDMYMRRARSPPRDYRDYYDRPPMGRDYYDMPPPPPRREAAISYPLPSAYRDRGDRWDQSGYGDRPRYEDRSGYENGPRYREADPYRGRGGKAPPMRPSYSVKAGPLENGNVSHGRASYQYTNGSLAKGSAGGGMNSAQLNGAFTEDVY